MLIHVHLQNAAKHKPAVYECCDSHKQHRVMEKSVKGAIQMYGTFYTFFTTKRKFKEGSLATCQGMVWSSIQLIYKLSGEKIVKIGQYLANL